MTGTMGGQVRSSESYYDPPPTFLHEWTRSLLYLPSANKKSDTIVVFDRVNAQNPLALDKFTRYRTAGPAEQTLIQNMPALKQWVIHMPVQPALSADAIRWTAEGSQTAQVTTLLPAAQNRTIYDESVYYSTGSTIPVAERKWQVRITPQVDQQWDVFLNVVQVGDAGVTFSNELLSASSGDASGVLIHVPGGDDTVVMFNAVKGQNLPAYQKGLADIATILEGVRVRSTPYSFGFTSATAASRVFLCDLTPTVAWVAIVDGAAQKVSFDGGGVAVVKVAGAGQHTIQLTANGAAGPAAPGNVKIR